MVVLLTSFMDSGAESSESREFNPGRCDRPLLTPWSDANSRMDQSLGRDQVVFEVKIVSSVTSRPKRSNHRWHWVQWEADGFSILLFGFPRR